MNVLNGQQPRGLYAEYIQNGGQPLPYYWGDGYNLNYNTPGLGSTYPTKSFGDFSYTDYSDTYPSGIQAPTMQDMQSAQNTSFSGFDANNIDTSNAGLSQEQVQAAQSNMGNQGGGTNWGAWGQAALGAGMGVASAYAGSKPQYSAEAAGNGFGIVDNFLAQGNKSKGGTAMVNAGASVMNAGLKSGNGAMALVGGIMGTVGTGINAMFGSNINEERVNGIKDNIAFINNSRYSTAADSSQAIAQMQGINGVAGFNRKDIGTDGWFSHKARNTYNDLVTKANAAYAHQRSNANNAGNNFNINHTASMQTRLAAYGGQLDNNLMNVFLKPNRQFAFGGDVVGDGSNYPTGLTHIDEGSTHEDNPNQGVQLGQDAQGTPNLVEEGETVYDDYVFSARLKVPEQTKDKGQKEFTREQKILKKYQGKSYADASKRAEIDSGVDERPNDPIAKRGFESILEVLAQSQEQERQVQQLKEQQEAIANMSPQEFALYQQQLIQQAQAEQEAQQQEAQQPSPEDQMQQMSPEEQQAIMQQQQMAEMSPEQQQAMQQQAMQEQALAQQQDVQAPQYAEGGELNTEQDEQIPTDNQPQDTGEQPVDPAQLQQAEQMEQQPQQQQTEQPQEQPQEQQTQQQDRVNAEDMSTAQLNQAIAEILQWAKENKDKDLAKAARKARHASREDKEDFVEDAYDEIEEAEDSKQQQQQGISQVEQQQAQPTPEDYTPQEGQQPMMYAEGGITTQALNSFMKQLSQLDDENAQQTVAQFYSLLQNGNTEQAYSLANQAYQAYSQASNEEANQVQAGIAAQDSNEFALGGAMNANIYEKGTPNLDRSGNPSLESLFKQLETLGITSKDFQNWLLADKINSQYATLGADDFNYNDEINNDQVRYNIIRGLLDTFSNDEATKALSEKRLKEDASKDERLAKQARSKLYQYYKETKGVNPNSNDEDVKAAFNMDLKKLITAGEDAKVSDLDLIINKPFRTTGGRSKTQAFAQMAQGQSLIANGATIVNRNEKGELNLFDPKAGNRPGLVPEGTGIVFNGGKYTYNGKTYDTYNGLLDANRDFNSAGIYNAKSTKDNVSAFENQTQFEKYYRDSISNWFREHRAKGASEAIFKKFLPKYNMSGAEARSWVQELSNSKDARDREMAEIIKANWKAPDNDWSDKATWDFDSRLNNGNLFGNINKNASSYITESDKYLADHANDSDYDGRSMKVRRTDHVFGWDHTPDYFIGRGEGIRPYVMTDVNGIKTKKYVTLPEGFDLNAYASKFEDPTKVGKLSIRDVDVSDILQRDLVQLPDGNVYDISTLPEEQKTQLKAKYAKIATDTSKLAPGVDYKDRQYEMNHKVSPAGIEYPKMAMWPWYLGAGLQVGALAHNILTPTDYSNADNMIKASRNGTAWTPIKAQPIGDYVKLRPYDINYANNMTLANAKSADRQLANASNGNVGQQMQGVLANTYNTNLGIGNNIKTGIDYNNVIAEKEATFNRGTHQYNSQAALDAAKANQAAQIKAAGYTLEGLRSGYAMRQAIDDAKSKSISAGLTGIANLANNYAQQKFNNDALNFSLATNGRAGVNMRDKFTLNGVTYERDPDNPQQFKIVASKGGKLYKAKHRSIMI